MLRYALSTHIFQVFLITPFYLIFHLQQVQVWYVLGQSDMMNRHFTPAQAAGVTINCFPLTLVFLPINKVCIHLI